MTRTDNKTTLCKMRFNINACKNLSKGELDSLSDTAVNVFYFIQAFGITLKLRNFVNIWMIEDRVQDLDSSTCGFFNSIFMIICLTLTKTAKYKVIQNLTKKLLRPY